MPEVGEDIPLVDRYSGRREEAAVLGLRDEGADDRDAGRVGGDGVVDGVVREEGHRWTAHVMGGASDGPSSRTGEIDGGGRGRADTVGAKAGEEGGDVAGIRQGESFE